MLHLAMNVLQQGHQFLLEDIVIVRATQPAGGTEVFERDATLRAFGAVKCFQIVTFARNFDRLGFRQQVRPADGWFVKVLLSTLFAEMKLFDLLDAQNFGEMQSCRLRTALAAHASFPP